MIVHIGDGRYINVEEGALRKPLPKPEPLPTEYTQEHHGAWAGTRRSETMRFTNGRKLGHPRRMTDEEARKGNLRAKELAKRDMANLKKAGIDLGEAGNEALQSTIEIMRKPGELRLKLAAARQVLEWTMAKPAASQNLTVNTAEAWLDSLNEDNEKEETEDDDEADEATDTSTAA